jgi:hypothetical protein
MTTERHDPAFLTRRVPHASVRLAGLVFAARSKPRFMAHSWVEHAGIPLLPTGSGYHRLREL